MRRCLVDCLINLPGADGRLAAADQYRRRLAQCAGCAEESMSLLDIRKLRVEFGAATVVDDVSFAIAPGEKFALVGESGSGKTVTALSVLRLNQDARYGGSILFEGQDILAKSEAQMRRVRGKEAAMIFQEPMTALNPLFTIGNQIAEVLMLHEGLGAKAAAQRTVQLLEKTGIPEPARRALAYPQQLSGGQRQRALFVLVLVCFSLLLIAGVPPEAADRRRADHGARRYDPGADPRTAQSAAARGKHGGADDHARPEPGAPFRRPRRRDGEGKAD